MLLNELQVGLRLLQGGPIGFSIVDLWNLLSFVLTDDMMKGYVLQIAAVRLRRCSPFFPPHAVVGTR